MKRGRILLLGSLALVVLGAIYGARLIRRGFSLGDRSAAAVARAVALAA